MRSPEELSAVFRERGRKVTPQRLCVFRVLGELGGHQTAEAVHAAAVAHQPTLSLRTVYQVLHELADLGELEPLQLGTGATAFDTNTEAHHHLVCRGCGRVDDLYADFTDVRAPDGSAAGFRISRTEIVFRGLCEPCWREAGATPVPEQLDRRAQHHTSSHTHTNHQEREHHA